MNNTIFSTGLPIVIALNGTCSVGKSTLADAIAKLFNTTAVVKCDAVCEEILHKHILKLNSPYLEKLPKDLLSLLNFFSKEETDALNDLTNKEMYRLIHEKTKEHPIIIHENAICTEEEFENSQICYKDCEVNVIRVFVHSSLERIFDNIKKRNRGDNEIDHRPLSLPFEAIQFMYKLTAPQDVVLSTWDRVYMTTFFDQVREEFDIKKATYNAHWKLTGEQFFDRLDEYLERFNLFPNNQSVFISCKFPHEIIVDTSLSSIDTCAQTIFEYFSDKKL